MRIGATALLGLALAASGVAGSATAQDAQYSHAAITSGNLQQAERSLERETRAGSREPEVLLNLAAVYAMTHRADAARTLYTKILAADDASMVLSSSRIASAHDIARQGLRMLGRPANTQLTAR
jgi:Flp pilus assembly protein TadD